MPYRHRRGHIGADRAHGGCDLTTRPRATGLATAVTLVLAGCGSESSLTASPSPTAPAPPVAGPAGVDSCLVGTWRSTSISGSITIAGTKVAISGGAGEVLVIDAAGTIRTDEAGIAPVTGTAPDGTQYTLHQTGTATGKVIASAGAMAVSLDQPTSLTVTLLRNGTQVQSRHPGSANDAYTCTPTSSLVITGAGGTVTQYTPG